MVSQKPSTALYPRSFPCYTYNGKEADGEAFGVTGSFEDYGMRMYNTLTCRFISGDPLVSKFPELSSYQFASNRCIDGKDFNGLEYYTIHVQIYPGKVYEGLGVMKVEDHTKMTDDQIRAAHNNVDPKTFFEENSKSYGKLGKGVLYVYHKTDENGNDIIERTSFQLKPDFIGSRHGIYYGSECISTVGLVKDGYPHNEIESLLYYDFSKDPIDQVDALAKEHDFAYTAFAKGYPRKMGWLTDERTLEADRTFILGLKAYLINASDKNYIDPYTGKPPSTEAIKAAQRAITAFEIVSTVKGVSRGINKIGNFIKGVIKKLDEGGSSNPTP